MEKVRFGIIGLGNMGSSHLKSFKDGKIPGAVLTSVCDIKQDRLDWAKGVYGDEITYFIDYKDMFAAGNMDVVLIRLLTS